MENFKFTKEFLEQNAGKMVLVKTRTNNLGEFYNYEEKFISNAYINKSDLYKFGGIWLTLKYINENYEFVDYITEIK